MKHAMTNPVLLAALIEYAVILLLLKKRRKPRRTIDQGLKTLFSNGDAAQGRRQEEIKRQVRQTDLGSALFHFTNNQTPTNNLSFTFPPRLRFDMIVASLITLGVVTVLLIVVL